MGEIIALLIAMLLLIFNVYIGGFSYPDYEEFVAQAEKTVDMIINHVIGPQVRIDIFSNVVAYIIIIVVCTRIVNKNNKAFRGFCLAILSLAVYLFNMFMPFFFNGELRYNIGFFSYIAMILIECVTFIQVGLICTECTECVENHAANLVTEIFMMLTAFSGFIRGMAFFYDLPKIMYLFFGVQLFFAVVYHCVYLKVLKHREYAAYFNVPRGE